VGPLLKYPGSCLLVLLCFVLPSPAASQAAPLPDNQGTDFWLAFPTNYSDPTYTEPTTLTVFISSVTGATGTVTAPGVGFSAPFAVGPGGLTSVDVPLTTMISAVDTVTDQGIHLVSDQPVGVYGLNRLLATTDAYLALPTDILGTDHRVVSFAPLVFGVMALPSQLAVVATQNATSVTITPTSQAGVRPPGVPFTVMLDQGETYMLTSVDGSLSGTQVTSDKPIGVFGGHECANVPVGTPTCDHLIEQIPPIPSWGKSFVTLPLATRLNGDTFVMVASQDGTIISIDGVSQPALMAGQTLETILTSASVITANQPILMAQFSNGTGFDSVVSDPFMMLIPPYEQFQASYIITTPVSGFAANFVNVVVPLAGVGSVLLDGLPIPPGDFTPIGTSGFSGAQVPISLGPHALSGPLPFGVSVYGFDQDDSYGYPGGLSLAPVADAENLALTPPTASYLVGNSHCVTALVTDTNDAPLAGVRVDFIVTGPHPGTGFAYTNALGEASFCFNGVNVGTDTIEARVGSLSAQATVDWYILTPTPTQTSTLTPTPTVTMTPTPTITLTPTCVPVVFPNPYDPRFAVGGTLKLDCVTAGDQVAIYTLAGELVTDALLYGAAGGPEVRAVWDGRNQRGGAASPGIYYYAITRGGKPVAKGKFLLIR